MYNMGKGDGRSSWLLDECHPCFWLPILQLYLSEQSLMDQKIITFRTANGSGLKIISFKTHHKQTYPSL